MELTCTPPHEPGRNGQWLLKEPEVPFSTQILDWGLESTKRRLPRHPSPGLHSGFGCGWPPDDGVPRHVYFSGRCLPGKGLGTAPDSPRRAAYLQWLVYGTATLEPSSLHPSFAPSPFPWQSVGDGCHGR